MPLWNHSAALIRYARSWSLFCFYMPFPACTVKKLRHTYVFFQAASYITLLCHTGRLVNAHPQARTSVSVCLPDHTRDAASWCHPLIASRCGEAARGGLARTEKSPAHHLAQLEKSFCTCAMGVNTWIPQKGGVLRVSVTLLSGRVTV